MTKRQRLFFKELLESRSNSEAARNAGYSSSSARVSAHKNITKYNEFYLSLFVEAGIDVKTLANNLHKGMVSKDENVKFKYTKLILETINTVMSSDEFKTTKTEPKTTILSEYSQRLADKFKPQNWQNKSSNQSDAL